MNHISIDKLYNPQYDLLSVSDKKALLNTLAAIYNLELICFKEFKALWHRFCICSWGYR